MRCALLVQCILSTSALRLQTPLSEEDSLLELSGSEPAPWMGSEEADFYEKQKEAPAATTEDCSNPWHQRCGVHRRHKVKSVYVAQLPDKMTANIENFHQEVIASSFTDVILSFINLCDAPESGETFDRSTCHPKGGMKDPELWWNDQLVTEEKSQKLMPYFAEMAKTKKLWLSVGAWGNDRTFRHFAECKPKQCEKTAQKIKKFMDDHSITGLDIDYEATYAHEAEFQKVGMGFGPLVKYMKAAGVTTFSSAPYSHRHALKNFARANKDLSFAEGKTAPQLDKLASSTGIAFDKDGVTPLFMDLRKAVKTNPNITIGAAWQWCEFQKQGVTPLMNLQFYAGGYVGNTATINDSLQSETAYEFNCDNKKMKIPMEAIVSGMGVAGSSEPSASGYQCSHNEFAGCHEFMKEVRSSTGGVFTWEWDSMMEDGERVSFLKQ